MDFSIITGNLYVGTTPTLADQARLLDLGIELIINMRFERKPHRDSPILTLWLPTIDSPLIWIPVRVLKKGVDAALETIHAGGKVYVHCHGGIHRAVAMASCILISQGYNTEEAMNLVKSQRSAADPHIWYIRRQIVRFAETWAKFTVR